MKIKRFFKLYMIICVMILILQLFPYLIAGKWYSMIHHYAIAPVSEWIDSWESWILPMICSSIIVSCILALIIMILIAVIQKFIKK